MRDIFILAVAVIGVPLLLGYAGDFARRYFHRRAVLARAKTMLARRGLYRDAMAEMKRIGEMDISAFGGKASGYFWHQGEGYGRAAFSRGGDTIHFNLERMGLRKEEGLILVGLMDHVHLANGRRAQNFYNCRSPGVVNTPVVLMSHAQTGWAHRTFYKRAA